MSRRRAIRDTTPTAAHQRADTDLVLDVHGVDQWAGGHAPSTVV